MQALIPSKALQAQKDGEEVSAQIAINNLRSKFIDLRHNNEEEEDMLNTLADNLIERE